MEPVSTASLRSLRDSDAAIWPDLVVFCDVADGSPSRDPEDPGEWPGTYRHIREVVIPLLRAGENHLCLAQHRPLSSAGRALSVRLAGGLATSDPGGWPQPPLYHHRQGRALRALDDGPFPRPGRRGVDRVRRRRGEAGRQRSRTPAHAAASARASRSGAASRERQSGWTPRGACPRCKGVWGSSSQVQARPSGGTAFR